MKAKQHVALLVTCALCACAPFIILFAIPADQTTLVAALLMLNAAGWIFGAVMCGREAGEAKALHKIFSRYRLSKNLHQGHLQSAGLMIEDMDRRYAALRAIGNKDRLSHDHDLGEALRTIADSAYHLFHAHAVELALFDEEMSLYHSAVMIGSPRHVKSQAMLSAAVDRSELNDSDVDLLVEPINFAGTNLGTLRVELPEGSLPTPQDREILHILALQASVALINANYSKELVKMKQSSEESLKAKTGFLANLSHEIRGPLGIMLNAVELVLDRLCGEVAQEQEDVLKMVRSNGEHLLELINDVLDYAKVESGRLVPQIVPILVDDMLNDITGVVRSQADAKGHMLVFTASPDPLAIECDRRHLRQMLINLLTNAIKYTPNNGTISVWAERAVGGRVRLNVKDTGVGIATENRDKVFAAFERVNDPYSMSQLGTGLGMPLTKRLAEVNGGAIDFTSSPGEGSRFWLQFTAIPVEEVSVAGAEKAVVEIHGNNDRVLFAARADEERDMVVKYLQHNGFVMSAVKEDVALIAALREPGLNMLLVDSNYAENLGDRFFAIVQENMPSARVPIVLLTTRAFTFDVEKYLKMGIDRCLFKPVHLHDLGQVCREIIDEYKRHVSPQVVSGKSDSDPENVPFTRVIKDSGAFNH